MYSPTKDINTSVRIGLNNKKKYIVYGTRKIKKPTQD